MNLDHHRRQQERAATVIAVSIAWTGAAGALSPVVEHAITVGLVVLAGLALLVGLLRLVLRVAWERQEDAANAIAGAAWRAKHMPHLARRLDQRTGVS